LIYSTVYPILIHFIDLIPFYSLGLEEKREITQLIEADVNNLFKVCHGYIPIQIHYTLKALSILVYAGFCWSEYTFYKDKIQPGIVRETKLIILGFLFFSLMQSITLLNGYFGFHPKLASLDISFLTQLCFLFLTLIFFAVFTIGHFGQKYSATEVLLHDKPIPETDVIAIKNQEYFTNKYPEEVLQKYGEKIKLKFKTESLYLDPNLDSEQLAEAINIHPKDLSYIINCYFNTRFSELVNSHRVEHAKKLLISEDVAHLTMEGIGNLSGFKSKSTFYRVFKQYEGCTPAEFL
jgi:AraC-like DNA-binding protein